MTTREYFEAINDETIRKQAIENMQPHTADAEVFDMATALANAFIWSESPQGLEHWLTIYLSACRGEI